MTTHLDIPNGLGDTGANICMTDKLDLLTNVVDIKPFSISVALESDDDSLTVSQCTKCGYLHLPMLSGASHRQICYYNPASSDTIISPQAICADSRGMLTEWCMRGNTSGSPGSLRFSSPTSAVVVDIPLQLKNGLYYCAAETFQLAHPSVYDPVVSLAEHNPTPQSNTPKLPRPTTRAKQVEAELWSAQLGFLAEWQLDVITAHADGLPTKFAPHPFSMIPEKVAAAIEKKPGRKTPTPVSKRGERFFMDFGFMRASTFDYLKPNATQDRIVESYDGFNSYLAIVDELSKFIWIFLCKSKEPSTDMVCAFLTRFGRPNKEGGMIRTDQGGELARSELFRTTLLEKHNYVVEPTGANSPSQNGQVEKYNHVLGVTVRVLLYSSGLRATYWSAALLHAVYLHNRRCHKALMKTPYEAWYGLKPRLKHLRVFGSKVSVKKTGKRRAKLDRHSFRGIFLGYTATDHNIRYVDIDSGITKRSHHAVFDEAWYTAKTRPPAAQFLYDLGLTAEEVLMMVVT